MKLRPKNYFSSQFIKMSTIIKRFSSITIMLFLIFSLGLEIFSQDTDLKIKISVSTNSIVKIYGEFAENKDFIDKNWALMQSYADAENLGERFNNFKFFDKANKEINYKKFSDSEYLVEKKVKSFSYDADLNIPQNRVLMAHLSWLDKSQGMIMPSDIFPQFNKEQVTAQIYFELPKDWKISTREKNLGNSQIQTDDLEKSVIMIGNGWREKRLAVEDSTFNMLISGEWQFSDENVVEMTQGISKEYSHIFGKIPFEQIQVFIVRLPQDVGFGRWRAETRGANVVIFSSLMPFDSQGIQRLHEQLRHEIFHLWIPNSLQLSGDYAWFYEGFAVYQALKTGVWTGQIRFEDFLNTISQTANLVWRLDRKYSLIDASMNRWQIGGSSLYSKGLLAAFLCDLSLLKKSKGKKDLEVVLGEIYQKYANTKIKQEANKSILDILESYDELNFVVEKHIKGSEEISWTNRLDSTGIIDEGNSSNIQFKLKKKLSGREKAILEKLGYNRWREILRKSK